MHVLCDLQHVHGRTLPELWRGTSSTSEASDKTVNYRHVFHAGNFADVVKHLALVAALLHLKKKDKAFRVIDSHAGRGLYAIKGEEAARTKEAEQGIQRLRDVTFADPPLALATYLKCVRAEAEGHYPGSPRLAARLLRPQDRLTAIEKHPQEAAALASMLKAFPNARAICADGYEQLHALLPPPERRGVILIDPPYELPDEFERASRLLAQAYRCFSTGIYLVWFPIKSKPEADAFCGEAMARGIERAARIDVDVGGGNGKLCAAGLLVVNPPYGLVEEMGAAAVLIAPLLGETEQNPARIVISEQG
jgi:23S rRNA (adenine2030-N6)-methyltransferase